MIQCNVDYMYKTNIGLQSFFIRFQNKTQILLQQISDHLVWILHAGRTSHQIMNEAHEGSCRQAPIIYTSHAAVPPSPFIPSLPHQPVVSSIHLRSHTQDQPARGTHFKPNPFQMQPHSKSRVATVNAARISCKVD